MERDIQSVLQGQVTFNGMKEMRQGRQCWALLQSVVGEGLSAGDLGNDGKELRERSMWTVGKRILQTEGAEKALESRFWMSSGGQSWGQTMQGLRANGQVL